MGVRGFLCLALPLFLVGLVVPGAWAGRLKVGHYESSCPQAEEIIKNVVARAVQSNPGIAAGIIRMHFHDCFVRGCDASVLLDSTPGSPAERQHPANHPSLRGFEVIDEAKAELESCCPNTVSCADVLAFAARDSAYYVGGIYYALPGGRRDGTVSLEGEVGENLPLAGFNAEQLRDNFDEKEYLEKRCPPPGDDGIADLDVATPNVLDVQYYKNLMKSKGVLTSDQILWDSPLTARLVASYVENPMEWVEKYGKAMVKMGAIDVLTGNQGEIRKRCYVFNSQ